MLHLPYSYIPNEILNRILDKKYLTEDELASIGDKDKLFYKQEGTFGQVDICEARKVVAYALEDNNIALQAEVIDLLSVEYLKYKLNEYVNKNRGSTPLSIIKYFKESDFINRNIAKLKGYGFNTNTDAEKRRTTVPSDLEFNIIYTTFSKQDSMLMKPIFSPSNLDIFGKYPHIIRPIAVVADRRLILYQHYYIFSWYKILELYSNDRDAIDSSLALTLTCKDEEGYSEPRAILFKKHIRKNFGSLFWLFIEGLRTTIEKDTHTDLTKDYYNLYDELMEHHFKDGTYPFKKRGGKQEDKQFKISPLEKYTEKGNIIPYVLLNPFAFESWNEHIKL